MPHHLTPYPDLRYDPVSAAAGKQQECLEHKCALTNSFSQSGPCTALQSPADPTDALSGHLCPFQGPGDLHCKAGAARPAGLPNQQCGPRQLITVTTLAHEAQQPPHLTCSPGVAHRHGLSTRQASVSQSPADPTSAPSGSRRPLHGPKTSFAERGRATSRPTKSAAQPSRQLTAST
ncbi:hypothetical protein NDU88_004354 [Pleurodeles waltl]|uniref:Uncharacterized protein n=1 Tax=Pleurodeles waltl TaxID=8319 RepID=A0AAV7W7X0_PLEWA|nr:hypothetical protein NDU88_004354 [Pleurodeles waltl]